MLRLCLFVLLFSPLGWLWSSASPLSATYATLDPTSIAQHFAFYELYPESAEGQEALRHAWELLHGNPLESRERIAFPEIQLTPLIALVNRSASDSALILKEEELQFIESLARHLGNRRLPGFGIWDTAQLDALLPEEIDLARALLLFDRGGDSLLVRTYEASIDLMALQILARLPQDAAPLDKIRAMNDYIFGEMRFRFPPHALWVKDIDLYTLLPSVLDSRRGVCLGVSVLYLALAQRLDLPLEIVTPPGHIYVRYVSPEGETTNIETTARGIDPPSELYLGLETRALETRTMKEVIGLVFMNQAAVAWHKMEAEQAIVLYEQGRPFLPNDYLLQMFLGYNYLFVGREGEGRALLEKIRHIQPNHTIAQETLIEDYLSGKTDVEGIQAVFSEVDEQRVSILEKQKRLEAIVAKYPLFRQGIFHQAITYLQLGQEKRALPLLERYIQLDPDSPVANYYLAVIHFQRLNFNRSWASLHRAEEIVSEKQHKPRALQELREALKRACPEPKIL